MKRKSATISKIKGIERTGAVGAGKTGAAADDEGAAGSLGAAGRTGAAYQSENQREF